MNRLLPTMIMVLIIVPPLTSGSEVIKIGTFIPKSSPWGQIISVWTEAVNLKSGGLLNIQMFFNGQQGDEVAMVNKIKAGQLDGAFLTAIGLGRIYKPIMALQMPGLFTKWTKLIAARQMLNANFTKGLETAGFKLVGWSDFGAAHLLSKGFAVRVPSDMRGKKPFLDRNNPMETIHYQVIGGVTPVPLSISEVLPQLNVNGVNVVNTASLLAEHLQWSSQLDTINLDINNLISGGFVLSTRRLTSLPSHLVNILIDLGKIATDSLMKRIQGEDSVALLRQANKMNQIVLTTAELSQWNVTYKEVRRRLGQTVFSADLVAQLEQVAK